MLELEIELKSVLVAIVRKPKTIEGGVMNETRLEHSQSASGVMRAKAQDMVTFG